MGGGATRCVALRSDMTQSDVLRGLGIDNDEASSSTGAARPMEEETRAIWTREMAQIKREMKAVAEPSGCGADRAGFDDAFER